MIRTGMIQPVVRRVNSMAPAMTMVPAIQSAVTRRTPRS